MALKIQSLIPQPTGSTLINNYTPVFTNSRLTYIPSVKIDYSLSLKAKLSGYWSRSKTSTPNNNGLPQAD